LIRTERLPRVAPPPVVRDPEILAAYLEDASGARPGHASGLVRPASDEEAAAFLAGNEGPVLPQAARSSLTGGAIPRDETVLSVERMTGIGPVERRPGGARVTVRAGVRLVDLQHRLEAEGWYYPPVPTYREAMVGGTISTNAGGPASFKYGVTRDWVAGLRVLLFNGEMLTIERGQTRARPGEPFLVRLTSGDLLRANAPDHRLPDLKKISAGYHASDPLDLIDLFIGSEGTLGLIVSATLDLVPLPPAVLAGLVFLPTEDRALELAAELRRAARAARTGADPAEPDVRSIESLDGRCLALLRKGGDARRLRVELPESAGAALLFEMELPEPLDESVAEAALAAAFGGTGPARGDHPLERLLHLLREHDALDQLQLAFPEDTRRRRDLEELREAVPQRVAEILALRRADDPAIEKVGGDMIVPPDRLGDMVRCVERGFGERGLEFAVWGHLSDGNLHPNALPRNAAEVRAGFEALLDLADAVVGWGGSPLSEHGVGRSAIKQEMLRRFLGEEAIASMRRVKRGLDPHGRLARGVLFPVD
jgi:D-lactate dehydrogenase (cytochrome)